MASFSMKCISLAIVSFSTACFGGVTKDQVGNADRVILKFDQGNTDQVISNFRLANERLGTKEWTSSFVDQNISGTVKYETRVFPWPKALDFSTSYNGTGLTVSRPVPGATKLMGGTDFISGEGLKVQIKVTMIPKDEIPFYTAGNRTISVYASVNPTIFPSPGGQESVQIGFGCVITNPDGSTTSNPGGIARSALNIGGAQNVSLSHPSYDISKCTEDLYMILTYGVSSSVSINELSWSISQL